MQRKTHWNAKPYARHSANASSASVAVPCSRRPSTPPPESATTSAKRPNQTAKRGRLHGSPQPCRSPQNLLSTTLTAQRARSTPPTSRGKRECRRRCTAASQRPGESILIRDAGSCKRRAADRRASERERRRPRGVTISGESAAIAGSLHPLCGRGRMERQLVCGDGVATRGLTRRRPPDGRCPRMCGNRRSALAP